MENVLDEDGHGKTAGAGGLSFVLAPVLGIHVCKLHAFLPRFKAEWYMHL